MQQNKDDLEFLSLDDSKHFKWQDDIDADILRRWKEVYPDYDEEVDESLINSDIEGLSLSQLNILCDYDLDIYDNPDWVSEKNGQVFPSDICPVDVIKDFNTVLPYNLIPGYLHSKNIPVDSKIELVTIDEFVKMRGRIGYSTEQIESEMRLLFSVKDIIEYKKR